MVIELIFRSTRDRQAHRRRPTTRTYRSSRVLCSSSGGLFYLLANTGCDLAYALANAFAFGRRCGRALSDDLGPVVVRDGSRRESRRVQRLRLVLRSRTFLQQSSSCSEIPCALGLRSCPTTRTRTTSSTAAATSSSTGRQLPARPRRLLAGDRGRGHRRGAARGAACTVLGTVLGLITVHFAASLMM